MIFNTKSSCHSMPLCCRSHCTFCSDLLTGKCWHYHGSSDCFDNQKKPCLNQATQKNICQIFQHKKYPGSKIANPQKFFDHPQHLKSKVHVIPSPPPPPGTQPSYTGPLFLITLLEPDIANHQYVGKRH